MKNICSSTMCGLHTHEGDGCNEYCLFDFMIGYGEGGSCCCWRESMLCGSLTLRGGDP